MNTLAQCNVSEGNSAEPSGIARTLKLHSVAVAGASESGPFTITPQLADLASSLNTKKHLTLLGTAIQF